MMENSRRYWRLVDDGARDMRPDKPGKYISRVKGSTRDRLTGWTTRIGATLHPGKPSTGPGIHVGTELWDHVGRVLDKAAPAVAAAMDIHMSALATATYIQWPWRTGYSASALTLAYAIDPGGQTFRAKFVSLAEYTAYIRTGAAGGVMRSRRRVGRRAVLLRNLARDAGIDPRHVGLAMAEERTVLTSRNPWRSFVPGREWGVVQAIARDADANLRDEVNRG